LEIFIVIMMAASLAGIIGTICGDHVTKAARVFSCFD